MLVTLGFGEFQISIFVVVVLVSKALTFDISNRPAERQDACNQSLSGTRARTLQSVH